MLCKHCTFERCEEKVSELVLQCTECEGEGCRYCEHGRIGVADCPQALVSTLAGFWDAADMMDKGLPPVSGGSLEQSLWFTRMYQRLKADQETFNGYQGHRAID